MWMSPCFLSPANGHINGIVRHDKTLQCFVKLFSLCPVFLDCSEFSAMCLCIKSRYLIDKSLFPVAIVHKHLEFLEFLRIAVGYCQRIEAAGAGVSSPPRLEL